MNRSLIDSLPPPADAGNFAEVRRLVASSPRKTVVLDDDPTGTQTVHGLDVLADWSVGALSAALADPRPCFYVLTNTRSLPADEAAALVGAVSANLAAAAGALGAGYSVISRGDSTLRGHFAEELAALERGPAGPFDGTIVIPAFFEGGRYTVGDIHYVAQGENLVPAAETEFARDRVFGYSQSGLPAWIEEKTRGAVRAGSVASVDIATLRGGGAAAAVRSRLLALPRGGYVVVNAAAYADLEAFTRGLLEAEESGRRYLVRSAASFVRVRAGLEPRPLLSASEISGAGPAGGLVVIGSYVGRTTVQLESLLDLPGVAAIELAVGRLAGRQSGADETRRAAQAARRAMAGGRHAVVFTSRGATSAIGAAGDLKAGRIVSDALAAIVGALPERPRFLIAKGGITSSDIAVKGLGMRRATVLGQASPGVPVWAMGPESRFPGLRLVVWPGNVGGPDALRDLVRTA